jgi:hypothetical protein
MIKKPSPEVGNGATKAAEQRETAAEYRDFGEFLKLPLECWDFAELLSWTHFTESEPREVRVRDQEAQVSRPGQTLLSISVTEGWWSRSPYCDDSE